MLAIVASCVVFIYILVPAELVRLLLSFAVPLRYSQRSRVEQIWVDLGYCLLPFAIALFLVTHVQALGSHPFFFRDGPALKRADYRLVASSLWSGPFFQIHQRAVWSAAHRIVLRQSRLLLWFLALVVAEGLLFRWLALNWARYRWKGRASLELVAEVFLLRHVSQWYVIFRQLTEPPQRRGSVRLNVMAKGDHLYSGTLWKYDIARGGDLSGIVLHPALRFDRRHYLLDEERRALRETQSYWRPIPGQILYIPGAEIANLNLEIVPPSDDTVRKVSEALNDRFEIDRIGPASADDEKVGDDSD